MEPIGYYLFDKSKNLWLAEDQTKWVKDFGDAHEFTDFDEADQHLKYWESAPALADSALYVFGVMPSS